MRYGNRNGNGKEDQKHNQFAIWKFKLYENDMSAFALVFNYCRCMCDYRKRLCRGCELWGKLGFMARNVCDLFAVERLDKY